MPALMYASKGGYVDCVEALLEKGADHNIQDTVSSINVTSTATAKKWVQRETCINTQDKVKVQSSWSQHKHACVHRYKNILRVNTPSLTQQMDSTFQVSMQLPIYRCLHNLNGLGDMHCGIINHFTDKLNFEMFYLHIHLEHSCMFYIKSKIL